MKVMKMAGGCCGDMADAVHPGHGEHGSCCGMTRRFFTKEEIREALESYRDELKKELQGLEEHLKAQAG